MTRVEALEEEIKKLLPDELAELRIWILERDWQEWDHQIERDSASGKLDKLFDKSQLRSQGREESRDLKHFASPDFWDQFNALPTEIQRWPSPTTNFSGKTPGIHRSTSSGSRAC